MRRHLPSEIVPEISHVGGAVIPRLGSVVPERVISAVAGILRAYRKGHPHSESRKLVLEK
jgi:hypothetical protein